MDVTRENFDHLFPEIRKAIEDAAFIAIDGEFTGLSTSTLHDPALFDTPETRYAKLRKSLSNFALCQCGLSMYVPSQTDENSYKVYTFNFFLSAPSFGPIDSKFLCQASALEFLTNHNFDFNACFKHGVSYLNKDEAKLFWDYHKQDSIQHHISSLLHRQYDEKCINPALAAINQFLNSDRTDNDVLEITFIPKGLPQYLFLKTMEKLYSNISCFIKKNGDIIVKRNLADEKASLENQYEILAKQIVGFSSVMYLISDLKKTLIGHNMLADLIFIYRMFFHSLPDTFLKFKTEIHKLFPSLYDTKHIAFTLRREFRNVDFFEFTSLGELYEVLSSSTALYYKLYSPHIIHAEGFMKYANEEAIHEAGYDAYLTGYIFLRLAHIAANKNVRSTESQPLELQDHYNAVSELENCINITRAAVRYLNFAGKDPPLNFPDFFIVTKKNKSSAISAFQVAQDFLPFGSVDVRVRGQCEALVAVSNRKASKDVVKAFSRNKFYYVVKYKWYHSQQWKTIAWYGSFGAGGFILFGAAYFIYRKCTTR